MNWDAVGAVREVGGAIAVVAMLVYPARQIRQSAEANIAGTQFAIPAEFNRVHEMDDCQPNDAGDPGEGRDAFRLSVL